MKWLISLPFLVLTLSITTNAMYDLDISNCEDLFGCCPNLLEEKSDFLEYDALDHENILKWEHVTPSQANLIEKNTHHPNHSTNLDSPTDTSMNSCVLVQEGRGTENCMASPFSSWGKQEVRGGHQKIYDNTDWENYNYITHNSPRGIVSGSKTKTTPDEFEFSFIPSNSMENPMGIEDITKFFDLAEHDSQSMHSLMSQELQFEAFQSFENLLPNSPQVSKGYSFDHHMVDTPVLDGTQDIIDTSQIGKNIQLCNNYHKNKSKFEYGKKLMGINKKKGKNAANIFKRKKLDLPESQSSHSFKRQQGSLFKIPPGNSEANPSLSSSDPLPWMREELDFENQKVSPESMETNPTIEIPQPRTFTGCSEKVTDQFLGNLISLKVNTKLEIPRISFHRGIFDLGDLKPDLRKKIELMLQYAKLPPEDPLIMALDKLPFLMKVPIFKKAEETQTTSERKSYYHQLTQQKTKFFYDKQDTWFRYWKHQTKKDFKIEFPKDPKYSNLGKMYCVFLYYVEMIITIIPKPEDSSESQDNQSKYCQDLESARECFLELTVPGKVTGNTNALWSKRKQILTQQLMYYQHSRPSHVWNFVQFWMERNYESLWNSQKTHSDQLKDHFKFFFNSIFNISIEKLTKRYSEIIYQDI
ncbi:hypothetical protein PGTUg99_004563 [Puccinia graminis f. sp. tritici]|uniref:Uncharacterized protein n=1 Tax=Puccinia graminis f. sp. tritici TaxID=56615 RepID=A0A5B0SI09_PUCGR|nr:hypothetical protein PGTUg99_004563 [Puccinia graminis f. sp. tritici]